MSESKLILVMGPQLSGLSAISCLFNILQPSSYPQQTDVKQRHASQQNFEYPAVIQFNDALLQDYHQSWYDIKALDRNKIEQKVQLAKRKVQLQSILESFTADAEKNDDGYYVIKDHRLSLTFPFWQTLVEELGRPHYCVFGIRDPREIALSCLRHYGLPVPLSYLLWKKYVENSIHSLTYTPHFICDYRRLIEDPITIKQLLLDYFPDLKTTQACSSDVDETIKILINADYAHHQAINLNHSKLEAQVVAVYTQLRQLDYLDSPSKQSLLALLADIDQTTNEKFIHHLLSKMINNAINGHKIFQETDDELVYYRELLKQRDQELQHMSARNKRLEEINSKALSQINAYRKALGETNYTLDVAQENNSLDSIASYLSNVFR